MYERDVWIRRDGGIAVTISIIPVTEANLDMVLPLIAAYQTFYHATPDTERNRAHFGALATTPALGAQWVATTHIGQAVGFVTAYRTLSSVSAAKRCLLNDLYVNPDQRGKGIGRHHEAKGIALRCRLIGQCVGHRRRVIDVGDGRINLNRGAIDGVVVWCECEGGQRTACIDQGQTGGGE